MRKLIIVGASGHGKVIADIARTNGYEKNEIVFLDDNESLKECGGYPVVGKTGDAVRLATEDDRVIVGIGNAKIRKRMMEAYEEAGLKIVTLIHPHAVIGENVVIEKGCVVMAGAVINPGTTIGKGCIINTCASVDHDCKLKGYVHVSVGAHVAGTVEIGAQTWIGAGATVSNNVVITADCMIGAGAVVVKDIAESGTYVGVPAGKR